MISTAQRMQPFQTQFFAGINQKIETLQKEGRPIIRLDIGSPDLPPSPFILEALSQSAARADRHGYQSHRGPQALRQAWAGMYARVYGQSVDPESEIVPLLGSKEGIFHFVGGYIESGDVVLIPDPGYLTYTSATKFAGGEPFYLPLLPEREYLPDLGSIPDGILHRAKILWLNYPNNPTSATATLEFFREAIEFGRRHGILICHDASYSQVTFDEYRAPSLFEADPEHEISVEFNTLSKSHNMAGWRVGAALGNYQILKNFYTLKTHIDSGHFLPVMEAAIAAMNGDQSWLDERNKLYARRRDKIIQALNQTGLEARNPKASLYVWSRVPEGWNSEAFCTDLLDKASLSLTPGTVFGEHGEGFMRICVCAPEQVIDEAMQRLIDWAGR